MDLGCLHPDIVRIILPTLTSFEMDKLRLISPLWNSLVLEQFRRRDPSSFIAINNVDSIMVSDKKGSSVSVSISKRNDSKFILRIWNNAFPRNYNTDDQWVHHDYNEFLFIATAEKPQFGLFISLGIIFMPIVSILNSIFYATACITYITSFTILIVCIIFYVFATVYIRALKRPKEPQNAESKESRNLKRLFTHGSCIEELKLDLRVADMETFANVRKTLGNIPVRKLFFLGLSMVNGEDPRKIYHGRHSNSSNYEAVSIPQLSRTKWLTILIGVSIFIIISIVVIVVCIKIYRDRKKRSENNKSASKAEAVDTKDKAKGEIPNDVAESTNEPREGSGSDSDTSEQENTSRSTTNNGKTLTPSMIILALEGLNRSAEEPLQHVISQCSTADDEFNLELIGRGITPLVCGLLKANSSLRTVNLAVNYLLKLNDLNRRSMIVETLSTSKGFIALENCLASMTEENAGNLPNLLNLYISCQTYRFEQKRAKMNEKEKDKHKSEEIPDFILRATIVWIKNVNFDSQSDNLLALIGIACNFNIVLKEMAMFYAEKPAGLVFSRKDITLVVDFYLSSMERVITAIKGSETDVDLKALGISTLKCLCTGIEELAHDGEFLIALLKPSGRLMSAILSAVEADLHSIAASNYSNVKSTPLADDFISVLNAVTHSEEGKREAEQVKDAFLVPTMTGQSKSAIARDIVRRIENLKK